MLKSEITINASPEKVWGVLTDFAAYRLWNPMITRVVRGKDSGTARISVRLISRVPPFSLQVQMIDLEEGHHFGWRGWVLSPRVFQGEHQFFLTQRSEQAVRFVQTEVYSGALAPVIRPFLQPLARRGFRKMDNLLKAVCESESECK